VRSGEHVRAWKPWTPGVREVFHARFHHTYPPHTHDTWTVFVVDEGAIRYDLDRHHRGARGSVIGVLPPHVVHDGRPADSRGYGKRVLYLEAGVLGEDLVGRAVDDSSVVDARLRAAVDALHARLRHPDDALEAESRLAFVAERLREHLTGRPAPRRTPHAELAEQLRALLDEHACEQLTLAVAADRLAASPAHLVRSFTGTFGVPPHAYLVGRRIEAARTRLLEGEPIVRVASQVGFFDQAHFTRHFKRHVGVTPAAYRG
jgi:AraC-like DNA-binding protein